MGTVENTDTEINTTEFYKIAVHVFVKFVNPIFVIEYKSVFTSVLLKCETFFSKSKSR